MNLRIALLIGALSLVTAQFSGSCPSFFSDPPDCATRQCLNGGYLDEANKTCICPSGYLGIHCEAVKTSMPPDSHFKAGGTSFNIMNVNLYTQYWGVQTYENIRKSVSNHFAAFPSGYDKYNLVETTGKPGLDRSDLPDNSTYSFQKVSPFLLSDPTDTGLYWCYTVPIYKNLVKMIRDANLKDTVITILTQHPPESDMQYQAREIAVAFGIRINVLWTIDNTFNRCNDAQVQDFKTFVDVTGGLFVQLQSETPDQSTTDLVSQVLLTHYKPQYVSIQSFKDCSTAQSVPVVIDPQVNGPYNFVFLGLNASPDIDSFRNCLLRPPLRSSDKNLAIFQSPDPMCSNFTITSNPGPCTAIVFTNANTTTGPLDLAIYITYVEDPSIDASRYAIVEGVPFYPAIHVESSSGASTLNSISASFDSSWTNVPTKRDPAAFEWISSKTITCDASQTYSLYLNISVDTTTVQRSVRVACVPPQSSPISPGASTLASSTPTDIKTSTVTVPSTSSDSSGSPSSTVTSAQCTYDKNYATFLFAYASDFDPNTYGLVEHTIGNMVTNYFPNKQILANKLIDMATPQDIKYTNLTLSFTTNLNGDQPNATKAASPIAGSDALDAIRKFLTDTSPHRLEGSTIIILVNRLPKTSDSDLSDKEYDQLTNLNIRVFPIITLNSLVENLTGRSGAVFNRIAAQTNGHYVVANDTVGRDVNSDFNKIVAKFMQTSYTQNLIFTRNIGVARAANTNLGTVRIPKSPSGAQNINVTITVSLSAVDSHQPQRPNRLFLGIKPNGPGTETKSIDFLSLDIEFANSNYYTYTVSLAAGIDRDLFLQYLPGVDQNDLLIRMWAEGDTYREATYIQYDESGVLPNISPINENFGAALKLKLENKCSSDKSARLLITDCNGDVSAKYDSDQKFNWNDTSSTFYQFIPFFCSSQPTTATCIQGAESKYDAQFVSDTFSITQSFQCRPGDGPTDDCQNKDANGNNQCSGSAPFKRGPTGSVYDCSNHGYLRYNENTSKFRCECEVNVSGDSCEVFTCNNKNNDPLATDNYYHTYTVVVGLENVNGPIVQEDAQILFGLSETAPFPSVWKYQLLTICADGTFDMVYSGSDLVQFRKMFATNIACNASPTDGAHDLTTIYKESVKGIGRNVKGIIVYFSEASNMINVTLDDFILASQPYQQQMFVYAVTETSIVPLSNDVAIAQAAMSTGGFLIQSYITNTADEFIDKQFIPTLLNSSSSIAWYSSTQLGGFSYKTESLSYLLTWKIGQEFLNQNFPPGKCSNGDNTSGTCKLSGEQTLNGVSDQGPFYVAAYLLNDVLSPKSQIISTLSQDASDAVSTSTSNSRTMLTINVPSTYTVVANQGDNGITRNAQRNNCAFDWTAYSVFSDQKYMNGLNIAKVTIQGPTGTLYTRFFPFGTSTLPVCNNGGTPIPSSGSCSCPSGFQGPDCSLVNCSEQSTSNAWSDVCVCAEIDDVACASKYTSMF
ncbi:hypothetical protein GCK72_012033 [Caenorhabditis remanei]|uniref:EGF-like domain-containing protein n=1 Tax=Caenorhabditis remanei TaxID=31234 RepID=A0A6A5GLM7_CAERE|nr:hypothetical protein GCK72_012033 [Caenorhabditis remanei]KAF1755583.1 hypothetical protein GCK72_012033 [Caenorhabditis remanei]